MAPKSRRSTRKKKQCWDLVVSTPEKSKGHKRKAEEDSGKRKKQKGESSSNINQERDPFYFLEDRDLERYNLDFSLRKVINGRWIDYDFFDSHNFDFSSKMDTLGWMPLTLTRDDVYPDLVAYFYANASRGPHSDSVKSYVKGTNIVLDKSVIHTLLGIKPGEEVKRQSIKRKNQLIAVYGENVNLAAQPRANTLSLELRLVHHFISTILIPKTGKFEYVSDRELFFLWAYVTDSKIDIALFILDQMHKATIKKISLPYGMLLTKIFKYLHVNLDDEAIRVPKAVSDEYNEKTLKRMGYELKGSQWTLKSSKRERGESSSKGKEPVESEASEIFETEMRAFMLKLTDSMTMLHTKIDNMAFRLVVVEKKVRNLAREVQKGKIPMENDDSETEEDDENEDVEQHKGNADNEENAGQKEKEESKHETSDDCSETESDASPILIRRKSQRLGRLSKFSNTATTALELSPSPSSSPSTPIHAPHASTSPPPHL